MTIRMDLYMKCALTVIAVMLTALALRPAMNPLPVQAQSDSPSLYIEPGITSIANPDTRSEVPGKLVVDLKTGEVWGFPTIFANSSKPPTSRPIYLGRYDFSAMKRVP
jgi:hypothetical protein